VKRASEIEGPAYVHILSVCPTGWRIQPSDAIKYGRLAVNSCVFPLFEVVNGKYRITYKPSEKKLIPVSEYLSGQGRFRHLTDKDIEQIQAKVTHDYEKILKLGEEA
jgi:pyruvate ferredoxin oxidoreductase beta subunit